VTSRIIAIVVHLLTHVCDAPIEFVIIKSERQPFLQEMIPNEVTLLFIRASDGRTVLANTMPRCFTIPWIAASSAFGRTLVTQSCEDLAGFDINAASSLRPHANDFS
jgi:hypothetical protein